MAAYPLISADSHIVEPPDCTPVALSHIPRSCPAHEAPKTPTGSEYDAWFIDDMQVGTLGAVIQAGQRFEDPSQIDFLGVWESVRKAAYDPHAMIEELEMDGVWGACLQPSQGLFCIASRTASCFPLSVVPTTIGSPTSARPILTGSRALPC